MTELHANFLKEFRQLLEKYNAAYESFDDASIHFFEEYDNNDVSTRSYSQLELPDHLDPSMKWHSKQQTS